MHGAPPPNASSKSLSVTPHDTVFKSSRTLVPDTALPARFCAVSWLPNIQDVGSAPLPVMYWSKVPVWGALPLMIFSAHGYPGGQRGVDIWRVRTCVVSISVSSIQYNHRLVFHGPYVNRNDAVVPPEMQGDLPLPCRAHPAMLVECKIVISVAVRARCTTTACTSSTSRCGEGRA